MQNSKTRSNILNTDSIEDQVAVGVEFESKTSVKSAVRGASVEEVASWLGEKIEDVQRAIDSGELLATKDSQGIWITEMSLTNFIVNRVLQADNSCPTKTQDKPHAAKVPGTRPECQACPFRNRCKAAAVPPARPCQCEQPCPVCWCRLGALRDALAPCSKPNQD